MSFWVSAKVLFKSLLKFLSASHETQHTWSVLMCKKLWDFRNFAFKIFGNFFKILNQQWSYLGQQAFSTSLTLFSGQGQIKDGNF